MALMVVSENWIPYESVYEKKLIDTLAKVQERSVKGLRYNLPPDKPTAAAMVQRQPRPVGLYIVPPLADSAYEGELYALLASAPAVDAWVWRPADSEMPRLPVP
jgi:hypothetical protein